MKVFADAECIRTLVPFKVLPDLEWVFEVVEKRMSGCTTLNCMKTSLA